MMSGADSRSNHPRDEDGSHRGIDIGATIILSLATLASAWCAYQSTLWGSGQTFALVAMARASREASEDRLVAAHQRSFDGLLFIQYAAARGEGSSERQAFLYRRLRPEMRRALDAWLETRPFDDPEAPPHPFQPQWYSLALEREGDLQEQESHRMFALAQQMNRTSDTYVMLTVLFSSTLFFGGMAGTFHSRMLKRLFGGIAAAMFLIVTGYMLTLPACRDCDVIESTSASARPATAGP
jgi:hypothetical protein